LVPDEPPFAGRAGALVQAGSETSPKEWKTPDGKAYFGDHPPEGSTVVKTVDKPIGIVETQPVAPRERVPLAEPQTVWGTNIACQDLRVTAVKEEGFRLRGTATHDGRHVVKDVRVCGGGVCAGCDERYHAVSDRADMKDLRLPSAQPLLRRHAYLLRLARNRSVVRQVEPTSKAAL
jgi:hypothetical protein